MILPFLEQDNLYISFEKDLPVNDVFNKPYRNIELSALKCPSDPFNGLPFERGQLVNSIGHTYARGNYGYNMGINRTCINGIGNCRLGFSADSMDLVNTATKVWGSGIGGFNVSYRLSEFPDGLTNIVAVDEIRAGISPIDSRGVWALGMGGASITGAHQGGPNSPVGDGITACESLKQEYSENKLMEIGMPCEEAAIPSNFAATARSNHSGLVNIARLDGSIQAVPNLVDSVVWLKLHSRDNSLAEQLSQ
jgi:hypothetical protein